VIGMGSAAVRWYRARWALVVRRLAIPVLVVGAFLLGSAITTATGAAASARTTEARVSALEASLAAHEREPLVLDAKTPIVARWEDTAGTAVLPPKRMTLDEYVWGRDTADAKKVTDLEHAFEMDLHNRDTTFHLTHEEIDGHTW
jgi:hypothetical protein